MPAPQKYPEELRERAVKMVLEIREHDGKSRSQSPCWRPTWRYQGQGMGRWRGSWSATGLLSRPTYFVSFITIGITWINHHTLFKNFSELDRPVLFLNLPKCGVIIHLDESEH